MIDNVAIHNLFGIQGLNINWYGIIMCVGIIAGVLVGRQMARKKGYTFDMIIDLMILALPLAIIGARLYYVIFEWERYAGDFMKIIAVWEGGLAIYGAVIGALIAVVIFCKWKKVPIGDILDIGAPGLILGQCIGRWGNFVNQEAFGNLITDPSLQFFPYGVYIERLGEWHQATFFYESLWNLLVFIALLVYSKKAKHRGNVFVAYLALYGVGRFFIEGLRTDSLWLVPGVIRVSQLLSAILVIGGVIYLAVLHKKELRPQTYAGKYLAGYVEAGAAEDAPEAPGQADADAREASGDEDPRPAETAQPDEAEGEESSLEEEDIPAEADDSEDAE